MASKDGKFNFEFSGTFKKVLAPEYLSYKLDDDRFVEIQFIETKEGTLISETFEAADVYSIEMQKNVWQSILNNFKVYC